MRRKTDLKKRILGMAMATVLWVGSLSAGVYAAQLKQPSKADEGGRSAVIHYGNPYEICREDVPVVESNDSNENLDWHYDPYPLEILIIEPDPEDDIAEETVELVQSADTEDEDDAEIPDEEEDSARETEDGYDARTGDEESEDDAEIEAVGSPDEVEILKAAIVSGDYSYTLSQEKATITKYSGSETNVSVPDKLDGYEVTSIGSSAFSGKTGIVSVELPSTIVSIGSSAFKGCSSLNSINLPAGLTSIGGSAFYNDAGLTGISIPSSVTSIGSNAFYGSVTEVTFAEGTTKIPNNACNGASKLTTVNIPATVTKIGDYAFVSCSSLQTVQLPGSLETIGGSAFKGCAKLNSVILPATLTSIGSNAFYSDAELTSITIPAGVTAIGDNAFYGSVTEITFAEGITEILKKACYGASKLTTVNFPASVKKIGDYAFSSCSSLQTIQLPGSLETIGGSAFKGCTKLNSVILPATLTTIGSNAFYSDAALTAVTVPKGVSSIGDNAFYGALTEITFEDGTTEVPVKACYGANKLTAINLPATVTKIGDSAFYNCSSLEAVQLPAGVESIGQGAFRGCSKLATASLPDSLTTIGANAFYSDTALTSITVPKGVNSIGESAFYGGLAEITFEDGTTIIPDKACYKANKLTTVNLPATVAKIGDSAFYNCSLLASIQLPGSLKSIGQNAFASDTLLTKITIPANVTSIGASAFNGSVKQITFAEGTKEIPENACSNASTIEEAVIPASVKKIGTGAFYRCKKMTAINLPSGLELIGSQAFYQCTAMETVQFTGKVEKIGSEAFYGCSKLGALDLPEGLTEIEQGAFSNCTGLEVVRIPSTVTSIGQSVFYNSAKGIIFANGTRAVPDNACDGATNLTEVTLPSGILSVGERSFYGCKLLEKVTLPEGVKYVGDSAFYGDVLLRIYIPDSLTEIGVDAFAGCMVVKKLGEGTECEFDLGEGTATVIGDGEAGNGKDNVCGPFKDVIRHVEVKEGVTKLRDHSFEGMDKLSGVVIGDDVTEIGERAFYGCGSLERVELSKGLELIDENAFGNCDSIKVFVFTGSIPQIADTALPDQNCTAYFPKSSSSYTASTRNRFRTLIWKEWDDTMPVRDVVLALDVSGSMAGQRVQKLKEAVCAFVEQIGGRISNTRIGIVAYDSDARRILPFTTDVGRMVESTEKLSANGGTVYIKALEEVEAMLDTSDSDVKSFIIFSDGEPNDSRSTILERAAGLRSEGIYIYSVGLMPSGTNRQLLIDISGDSENYFEADDIDELVDRFVELSGGIGRSGSCGDNVKWRFYEPDKQLVLSLDKRLTGNGKMQDFTEDNPPAWDAYAGAINRVSVESGVTYIGNNAFKALGSVTRIQLCSSLTGVGMGVFSGCTKLKDVYYPGTADDWKKVTIGGNNKPLLDATMHYESEDPEQRQNIPEPITGLIVKPTSATMNVGDVQGLKAEIFPKNAANKSVKWESTDPSVITVSSTGKVEALKKGEATIIATSDDGGYVGKSFIKVTNTIPVIKELSFDGSSQKISVDEDIPFFGGMSYDISLPVELPVNAAIEDNKIKLGINIPKQNLYSSNPDDGTSILEGSKSIDEQFEEFLKNAEKSEKMATDWIKNIQQNRGMKAKIPAVDSSVDINIVGYAEGAWSPSLEMQHIEGNVIFTLSVETVVETQLVVVVVPVTVNATVTGSGEITAKVGYNFPDSKWYGDLDLALKLGIEPYAGIGFERWLSGGVYGKGETEWSIALMSTDRNRKPGLEEWTLEGEMGLKGYFAKQDVHIALLKSGEPYTLYSREEASTSSVLTTSRKASKPVQERVVTGVLAETPGIYKAKPEADGTLVSDVYNAANPVLVTSNGVRMLVYVADDRGRSLLNQTRLVYSIYDDATGTYSDPMAVVDDGTADCEPEVYSDGKDIYIAWLDSTKIFAAGENPEFGDYMKTFRTHVAKYDTDNGLITDLGSPQNGSFSMTYLPRLYVSEGKPQLAWVENKDNVLFGLSGHNSVHRAEYDGTVWSAADTVGSLNMVSSLDIGEAQGADGIRLAYTVDDDNSLETAGQSFYVKTGAASPELVEKGNITSVMFTELPEISGTRIAVNKDGGLSYLDGSTLADLLPAGTMKSNSGFYVYDDKVVYISSGEGSRNLKAATHYNGKWGMAQLTHEPGYVDSFSVNSEGKAAYLLNKAKSLGNGDWDITSYIKVLDSLDYYDTELEGIDFALDDLYADAQVPIDLYIKNNGTSRVSKVNVAVSYGGNEIASSDIPVDIMPGETEKYGYDFKIPRVLVPDSDFAVTVTSYNDQDSSNDSRPLSLMKADLAVSTSFEATEPTAYINVLIKNDGLIDSNMDLIVTDETGKQLYNESGAVAAGNCIRCKLPYTEGKAQVLTVSVKGDKEEFYEMNNVTWQEVDERGEKKPDVDAGTSTPKTPEITVSDNMPMAYREESRGEFRIGYYSEIPFWGKSKPSVANFGKITIYGSGCTYEVSKIKINKKKGVFQITGLSGADRKVLKDLKKATKGSAGLPFKVNPYYVKDGDSVTTKTKKDGSVKSVKVTIFGKDYKAKKNEWTFSSDTKTLIFTGQNLAGSHKTG